MKSIDFRPATGQLFALVETPGSRMGTAQVARIDVASGVVAKLGSPFPS